MQIQFWKPLVVLKKEVGASTFSELPPLEIVQTNIATVAHVQLHLSGGDDGISRFEQALRAMGKIGDFDAARARVLDTSASLESAKSRSQARSAMSVISPIDVFAAWDTDDDATAAMEAAFMEEIEGYARTEPGRMDGDGPYTLPDGAGKFYCIECPKCTRHCQHCGNDHHLRCWLGNESTWIDEDGALHNPCPEMMRDPKVRTTPCAKHCNASKVAFLAL